MCVRGNCDWWPTRVSVWDNFAITGETQRNVVYEENGVINAIFIFQVKDANGCPMGTTITLPDWCMSGVTRWIPNISPGHATALSIERGLQSNGKVLCTINFEAVPYDGWIMLSMCWPAGL